LPALLREHTENQNLALQVGVVHEAGILILEKIMLRSHIKREAKARHEG
jgi:hypothetical protein